MSEGWGLRHIVVGTDFSQSSRGAVGEALRLAGRFTCTVSVVHVATDDAAAAAADEAMARFLEGESLPSSATLRTVVVRGSKVAAPLAEYVEREDADLLVVGPRARTFVEKHITGSIAEQLFSRTHAPVLATPRVSQGYRRVLVALDDSLASTRALEIAASLMLRDAPQGRLIALHVLTGRGVDAISSHDEGHRLETALVDDARAHYAPLLARHAADVPAAQRRLEIRVGALGSRVPQAVAEFDPDLVCMGTVGRRGVLGLLAGNAAEQVVRTIDRPLLVAHP